MTSIAPNAATEILVRSPTPNSTRNNGNIADAGVDLRQHRGRHADPAHTAQPRGRGEAGKVAHDTAAHAAPDARDLKQEEANRSLVVDFYDRFFNKHDVSAASVV